MVNLFLNQSKISLNSKWNLHFDRHFRTLVKIFYKLD